MAAWAGAVISSAANYLRIRRDAQDNSKSIITTNNTDSLDL